MSRRRFVVRLGRLRVQFWERPLAFEWMRLDREANPHWTWVLAVGIATLRWSRRHGGNAR